MANESVLPKAQATENDEAKAAERDEDMPTYATRNFWKLVMLVLLVMGMIFSLQINSWHLTVPVVVIWFGWGGVLATVGLIWDAGLAVANESSGDRIATLDVSEARRHELEAEKKSLIQAIKEIEFDRDLGKMSAEDATEMMKFYRARAIEVIKELDGQVYEELSVSERVKRDLEARLAVAGPARKAPKAAKKAAAQPAKSSEKQAAKDEDEQSDSGEDAASKEPVTEAKEPAEDDAQSTEDTDDQEAASADESAESNVKESA